jgi:hypothetical protein
MPWITVKSATVQLYAQVAREGTSYPMIIVLACSAAYPPAKCVMDLETVAMSVKAVTIWLLMSVLCVQISL